MEETGGFVIDYRKTVYYGLCGECAEASHTPVPFETGIREPAGI
jgi:hypothetical protein